VQSVQALSDGKRIYFRLSWVDPTPRSARPDVGRFLDEVALQFRLNKSEKTVVLMGNPGGRAGWRSTRGRGPHSGGPSGLERLKR
jgi:DMSO reductase family type II enzyme heme b subunit